jgi:hypothetical protein
MAAEKNGEKWKHLASRCRNLTLRFSSLDLKMTFVTVTGRERDGDGALNLFKHLVLAFDVGLSKGIGIGNAVIAFASAG